MINTRKLTEALEKKYSLDESWEEEFDDEYDYIMDDDSLSDEEKTEKVKLLRQKYDRKNESLNESFVEEWWGQTDEDPFDFAYDYGLTCAKIGRRNDEVLYRFTGSKEDIEQAIKDGYFYSMSEGEDEGHSEDLDESLTTETPLTVIKGLTGATTGAVIGAEMGHPLLGAASGLTGTLVGDVIWDKYGNKHDEDTNDSLDESFWDPTHWFDDLVDNYENWTAEEWNTWDQEKRDMEVTKAIKHFLIDNQLSEQEALEFIDDLDDNNFHTEARIFYDLYNRNNSLTEARNPENDEVNAIIRKHLGKKSNITKKEQEILDRYNISRDENGDFTGTNGRKLKSIGRKRKSIHGPEVPGKYGMRGIQMWDWSAHSPRYFGSEDSFNEVDYANYLTKEQPGEGKYPSENSYYYNTKGSSTPSEDKDLRPYSDTYKNLKGKLYQKEYNVELDKKTQPMSDEEIEAKVAEFRDKLERDRQRKIEQDNADQEEYNDAKKAFDDFRASIPKR